MRTHLAFLRGINVGGKTSLRMAELRAMVEELGLKDAATLLQSGNLVFSAPGRSSAELASLLAEATQQRFGMNPAYFVRTREEWGAILAENPFPEFAEKVPSHLLIHVGDTIPTVEDLMVGYSGSETLFRTDRALYVCFPAGIGDSKLITTPAWRKYGAPLTGRNWNTAMKLKALLEGS